MSKPVIYIPGYPGTHIHDEQTGKKIFLNVLTLLKPSSRKKVLARLAAPDDLSQDTLVAGAPIRRLADLLFFDLAKQAGSLYDILEKMDVDALRFGWDWRRPIWDPPMQHRLKQEIETLEADAKEPVTVIAHSTGGLVLRHLLENSDKAFVEKVGRVIAFGVPWAGALKSFLFLAGKASFAGIVSPQQAQPLVASTWAAYDLLPLDPATTDMTDANGLPLNLVLDASGHQTSPLLAGQRSWFKDDLRAMMNLRADATLTKMGGLTPSLRLAGGHVIPVTNVVGFGEKTAVRANIDGQDVRFAIQKEDDTLDGGDKTAPRRSVAWLRGPGVTTYHVPVGVDHGAKMNPHSTLWRNPGGRNLLRHLLGGKALKPFVYGAVDKASFAEGKTVLTRVVALDGAGQPLPDARVRAVELQGPPSDVSPFRPERKGRHSIRIHRQKMRKVGTEHRRFVLEFTWRENGQQRSLKRSFFVKR